MSYILTPIAVDLGQITAALGSRNQSLFDTLVEEFGDDFPQIDDLVPEDDDDADDNESEEDADATPAHPSTHDALRQLLFAEPYDPAVAFKYAYALEYVLRHFGDELTNDHWFSMRWDWAETVDQALAAAGVPANTFRVVNHLMTRGAPVPIPEPDDFPAIGHLRRAEIPAALQALRAATPAITDPEVAPAVAEIINWLESCDSTRRDLVCYYA
jgi:hypothetical protein